ncbi:hypothetical protein C2845_PM02G01290 [Panicum miliaceum]|uniref:Uncharacterized protein n=1 Tax=Panicum miliaceum TaxID=4540 RepID=A0A3L6S6W6_PANMI|nr:hypothetical protein C2845_PM02G01290 [Panicum miliaceum]
MNVTSQSSKRLSLILFFCLVLTESILENALSTLGIGGKLKKMQRRVEGIEFSPAKGWSTAARAPLCNLARDTGTVGGGLPGRGCPAGAGR